MWVDVKFEDIEIGNIVKNEGGGEFLVTWINGGELGGGHARNTKYWWNAHFAIEKELKYQRWEAK